MKRKATKTLASPRQVWDAKRDAFNAAKDAILPTYRAYKQALEDAVKAEAALAKAGLAAYRAGHYEPGNWLVWWWNNGATSPRDGGECIDHALDIPRGAQPKEPSEVLR